jgi:drug/metabolite transporter (DMT)-like permease
VLWATTLRVLGGTGALALVTLFLPSWRKAACLAFTPSAVWWFAVPGSVSGAYLALIVWVAGMKYTTAITASVLNQLSTLIVVLLATLFLKEALTLPKVAAMVLGIAGSVLVLL